VVKDPISRPLLSTANVVFASGAEASLILVGPGLAGLIVMIPSIPDFPSEGVCPVQAHVAITASEKSVSKLHDRTLHYIGMPSRGSTMRIRKAKR
jgi:hypothetical protein